MSAGLPGPASAPRSFARRNSVQRLAIRRELPKIAQLLPVLGIPFHGHGANMWGDTATNDDLRVDVAGCFIAPRVSLATERAYARLCTW